MTAHEQVAAFVLDALSDEEMRAFERHLATCPDCEDELEPLRLAAVALAFAGELPPPRPALRLRVLDVRAVVIPFRRRLRRPMLSVAAVAAVCAAAIVALTVPGGDASVAGVHAYRLTGAEGNLLVAPSGEAVLVVRMRPAPAGKTYEVWVVRNGHAIPAGLLRGSLVRLNQPVPSGAAVAVSLEPAGGSRQPTGALLIRAETA